MRRDLVAVSPATPLDKALTLMASHGLRHLNVVEADRTLVGVAGFHDARIASADHGDHGRSSGVLAVTQTATTTLHPDDSTEHAWSLLSRAPGLNPLPVVHDGKLVGTVSQQDLLRAMAGLPPFDVVTTRRIGLDLIDWNLDTFDRSHADELPFGLSRTDPPADPDPPADADPPPRSCNCPEHAP